MNSAESFHKKTSLSLLTRYGTPLAAILVLSGVKWSPIDARGAKLCLFLLAFSVFYNLFFFKIIASLTDETRSLLGKSRATLNLWVNVLLVLILGRTWPPIWLLLTLSGVATAVYGTRERTLVTAAFLSFLLVAINLFLHMTSPLEWGIVIVKAAFILLTSLMINDLARNKKETR